MGLSELRRWYNNEYLPAITKALKSGLISARTFNELNEPVEKYEFDYK